MTARKRVQGMRTHFPFSDVRKRWNNQVRYDKEIDKQRGASEDVIALILVKWCVVRTRSCQQLEKERENRVG